MAAMLLTVEGAHRPEVEARVSGITHTPVGTAYTPPGVGVGPSLALDADDVVLVDRVGNAEVVVISSAPGFGTGSDRLFFLVTVRPTANPTISATRIIATMAKFLQNVRGFMPKIRCSLVPGLPATSTGVGPSCLPPCAW